MFNFCTYCSDIHLGYLSKSLTEATDEVKDKICTMAGARYMELGLELGFEEEKLNILKTDHKGCHAITREILQLWIEREGPTATWKVLGDTLYEIRVGVDFIKDMFK